MSLRESHENFYVVGVDSNKYHLELSPADKKYISPKYTSPDYVEFLNMVTEMENVKVLCPQVTREVEILSEVREKLKAKVFLPSKEAIKLCSNKWLLLDKLSKNNIPTPESYLVEKPEDLDLLVPKIVGKSGYAWLRAVKGAGSKAHLPVKSPDIAKAWIKYWEEKEGFGYGSFMVSEFLVGREFAFQSLWLNGELVTSAVRERLEYLYGNLTPSGHSSSYFVGKTVHRDDVNRICTKAVKVVDPKASGIFCIDLKENSEGVPCITEINAGRFFTTSYFITKAGLNMPYMYVKLALGEKFDPPPKYNGVPENLYWVRLMDCGYKLVEGNGWSSIKL